MLKEVMRGVRPVERDQRAARPRLQGSLGRRQEAKAAASKRAVSCATRSTPISRAFRPTGATPIRASTR